MKIAMLLVCGQLNNLDEDVVYAIVFEVKNSIIISVDNDLLNKRNINYNTLWLLKRNIKELYVESVDDTARTYFERLGITIKTYEDMKDNELLKSFLL